MKTIKQQGYSKLVEYEEDNKIKRVVLPTDEDNPDLGIPHGLPFADLLQGHVCEGMAQRIEDELHRSNIWTAQDVLKNPATVQGAILAAYAIDYSFILQLAKKEANNG